MCETDSPDEVQISAPANADTQETGLWPLPGIADGTQPDPLSQAPNLNSTEANPTAEPRPLPEEPGVTSQAPEQAAQPPERPQENTPRIIAAIGQLNGLIEDRFMRVADHVRSRGPRRGDPRADR